MIQITNEDNMELMARYPDGYFDLAIVDPEYGIGASKPSKKHNYVKQKNGRIMNVKQANYGKKEWDAKPASNEYFDELLRVSKHQIIWGVNFYDRVFGKGRIVWDKVNQNSDQYDCEIAYNSLNDRTDMIRYMWNGMMQGLHIGKDIRKAGIQKGDKSLNEKRIHPTQKPVILYEKLLLDYAKPGFKILDTNIGSRSHAIAVHICNTVHKMDLTLIGCELDEQHFLDGEKWQTSYENQTSIFQI